MLLFKRCFDIAIVLLSLPFILPLALCTALLVKLTSTGSCLYWSKRVSKDNTLFYMPKFRSMQTGTPQIATHLMNQKNNANSYLTPVGSFIRKTSLDELPQIWSVLKGDMSVVGPRPALFNQDDLIKLRKENGVDKLKPGITGWAQINGRDEIPIPQKVALDVYYLENQSILLDLKIVVMTAIKVLRRDNITH